LKRNNRFKIEVKITKPGREEKQELTVSATLTLSFLSFSKLATSDTIALTFSGGNSFAVDILFASLLLFKYCKNTGRNYLTDENCKRFG
jgi:hypothetical protein